MKYSKNSTLTALLSALLLLGGCGQVLQQQQPPQEMPVQTASVIADCVVNYFQKDNAPYITQQQHGFNPETGYLQIVAKEPTGQYKFTLNKGNFNSTKQLTPFLSGLSASFVNQSLATALFYSFTAGAGLLNTAGFETQEAVKIEGQWYQPSLPPRQSGNAMISLLKNLDTNRFELVELSQTQMKDSSPELEVITDTVTIQKKWLLRNYNYRYSKELDTLVPMKIDIFDIRNGLASKQLIIQIDYKSILKK